MSTPPPIPEQPTSPRKTNLTKLAIIFAVTIAVTFGLCSITLISSNRAISGPIFPAAIIIEAICIVGLTVIAIIAIVKTIQNK